MYRRGRFRRARFPFRRGARRLIRRLRRAHRWMGDGDYRQAAQAFEELAIAGEQRGAGQAAQLYVQAGRARLRAGDAERGMDRIRHGLRLMVRSQQTGKLGIVLARILAELREHGLESQAAALEAEFAGEVPREAVQSAPAQPLPLPAKCPQCGATVRPLEVERLADGRAACEYCGSVLAAHE